jgi:NAD(P)H-hydrate repair Nnr-like enzyme with NAD(P)H-hydrate epimerase domain
LAANDAGEAVQIEVLPVTAAVGFALTVCVIDAVAGIGVAQLKLEDISTAITSPLTGV